MWVVKANRHYCACKLMVVKLPPYTARVCQHTKQSLLLILLFDLATFQYYYNFPTIIFVIEIYVKSHDYSIASVLLTYEILYRFLYYTIDI